MSHPINTIIEEFKAESDQENLKEQAYVREVDDVLKKAIEAGR